MAGARVLSAGRAGQPDARGGGQTDTSEAALGTVPGPLHPGGHSAAGLSLSLWPRMCAGLEQHQGSDDGNEERNRNAYGHSRTGRHPECGRPPAGSAPGSGTGAGGGQRPAPPPPRCGATWPRDPSLTRVLGGGPVSDGARAHVQMRLCGFKEGARLGGPAPPFATVLAHVINLIKVKLVLYIVSRK